MKHTMGLQPIPFELIKNGQKTIELRLYDEKRQALRIGDTIEFTCNGAAIKTTVLGFVFTDSFAQLFNIVPPHDCGFKTAAEGVRLMQTWYPIEKQHKIGVVGIKIKKSKEQRAKSK